MLKRVKANCRLKEMGAAILTLLAVIGVFGHAEAEECGNPALERILKTPFPRSICIPLSEQYKQDIRPDDWAVFRHWRKPLKEMAGLKAAHPNLMVFAYFNPTFYYKYYDCASNQPYAGSPETTDYIKGYDFKKDILPHKDWFVYRKGGYIPYSSPLAEKGLPETLWDENAFSSYYYPPDASHRWFTERDMDITNSEWREFAANLLATEVKRKGFDGLYLDDITTIYKPGYVQESWIKHIIPQFPCINEKWVKENIDFHHSSGEKITAKEWKDGLAAMIKLVKEKLPDRLVIYNGHHRTRLVDPEDELFQACDGWMAENFLQPNEFEAMTWNGYMTLVETITAKGKAVIVVPPYSVKTQKEVYFHFASCLLTDAIYWDMTNQDDAGWNRHWSSAISLGFPHGGRHELPRYPGVWTREYDKGVVIVNSNKFPINIVIPWRGRFVMRNVTNSYDTSGGHLEMDASSGEIILWE